MQLSLHPLPLQISVQFVWISLKTHGQQGGSVTTSKESPSPPGSDNHAIVNASFQAASTHQLSNVSVQRVTGEAAATPYVQADFCQNAEAMDPAYKSLGFADVIQTGMVILNVRPAQQGGKVKTASYLLSRNLLSQSSIAALSSAAAFTLCLTGQVWYSLILATSHYMKVTR